MMTSTEAAALLGCSPRFFRELAQRVGVGVRIGGRTGYRYSAADVETVREVLRPKPVQRRRRSA